MNIDSVRQLLYPLGYLASFLFGLRFYVQWFQSEKAGRTTVSKSFWVISLVANVIFAIHGFIQLQLPLVCIQVTSALIAQRNLELLGHKKCSLIRILLRFFCVVGVVCLLFFSQKWLFPTFDLMRTPKANLPPLWHLLGISAMVLFAMRFWVQWWLSERHQRSELPKSFWYMSLLGGSFSLLYFYHARDLVNIIGYGMGLIPYVRNLMLSKKEPPPVNKGHYFVFAGEQSGDHLGHDLLLSLKKHAPHLHISGVGGAKMRPLMDELILPMEKFQVMGVTAVLKALPKLIGHYRMLRRTILDTHPEAVILIDYAEFNMIMARSLRKGGYRGELIHYVCPSVWAWRKNRAKSLEKTLDRLLCILPFEPKLFDEKRLATSYVGHPLVRQIKEHLYDPIFTLTKPTIVIFPGSRLSEVQNNLPLQIEAVKKMKGYEIVICYAHKGLLPHIEAIAPGVGYLSSEWRYDLMKHAKAALATSGTIVLELGLHHTPTVVTYKLGLLNYILGRYIFRIILPHYTLPNIILNKTIHEEFFHRKIDPNEIAHALKRALQKDLSKESEQLETLLGTPTPLHEALSLS